MKEHDIVYSKKQLGNKIPANCKGTIVHVYHEDFFEVEFVDEDDETIEVKNVARKDIKTEDVPLKKVCMFLWDIIKFIGEIIWAIFKFISKNAMWIYLYLYFGYGFYMLWKKIPIDNTYLFVGMWFSIVFTMDYVDNKIKKTK